MKTLPSPTTNHKETTHKLNSVARHRAHNLETIQKLATQITATMNLDEVLAATCEAALTLIPVEHCGVVLFDKAHTQGEVMAESPDLGARGLVVPLNGIPLEETLINKKEPVIIPEVGPDSFLGSIYDILHSFNIHSILIVPVICKGQVLGSFSLDSVGQTRQFTTEDLELCQLLASHVAVAVENAALVAQLREQKDHFSRLTASSPNGIIAIDNQGIVTAYNEKSQEILKYELHEVLGKPVDFLYFNPQEPRHIGRLLHTSPDGKLTAYDTYVRSHSGEKIPIRLSTTWLYNAQGEHVGSVGYFEDLRGIQDIENRLALLLEASNVMTQAGNLTDGLRNLAEMMVRLFDTAFCHISLVDEEQQTLWAKAAYVTRRSGKVLNWQPPLEVQTAITAWPGLPDLIGGEGAVMLNASNQQGSATLTVWAELLHLEEALQTVLVLPLRTRDKVVGLIMLGELRFWAEPSFSDKELELAKGIAEQTAMLINRVRLHEFTERRGQLLAALDEASRHIRAERATSRLLPTIVRLAAELVGCAAGGLYINRPQLHNLELQATYKLPEKLLNSQLPHDEAVIGAVAQSGLPQIVHHYAPWEDQYGIYEPFATVVAVPLKLVGEVEAVLFVVDRTGKQHFLKDDLEILQRFAVQATLALQTSRLLNKEQRMFAQMAILHRVSSYIQAARDIDKILHVVLTGVTAGYGLGFNRAVLLLLDEGHEYLVGRLGIGHMESWAAQSDWERDHRLGLDDFGRYLDMLEQGGLPPTPIDEKARQIRLAVGIEDGHVFSQAVADGRYKRVPQEQLSHLPGSFLTAFQPSSPLVIAPLITRDKVIGLLVTDNKFTQAPITDEDVETLLTFANAAAIAIYDRQLFTDIEVARERLRASYEASNALISPQEPGLVLATIVEQARQAADASSVSLVLIDKTDQPVNLVTTGIEKRRDIQGILRPDGLSMQVMRTGQAVRIGDAQKARAVVNPIMLQDGVAAALCLPLSLQGQQIGVMWLHYDAPRHFPEFEIDALQLYVNQAAIAYDSARHIKKLEHMRQAAESLAGAASLPNVLQQIVRSAREVLEADWASIWAYDAVRARFIPENSVADGISPDQWEKFKGQSPQPGRTAYTTMKQGWLGVQDIADKTRYPFIRKQTRQLLHHNGVRSFQGIALTVGEEHLGVLYVNYEQTRSFSEEEQETARTLANHAALALKKAKLLEQVSKARNTAKIVAKVTTLTGLNTTLRLVVEGTKDALDADAVTLYVYEADKQKLLYPPTITGVNYPDRTQRLPIVEGDSIVWTILHRDRPYIVDNVREDPQFAGSRFTTEEGVQSCVAVPLQVGQSKVGAMFINYRVQHHFTSDDLANIELFANQAAVAIHDAQLYAEVQKRAGTLQSLQKASQAVTSSLELDETLREITRQAYQLLSYEGRPLNYTNIRLLAEDQAAVVAAYPPHELSKTKAQIGHVIDLIKGHDGRIGVMGRAVKTKQPQLVNDVTTDLDYLASHPETRSELALPIMMGGEVIGVFSVQSADKDAFDQQDVTTLSSLSAQAAIAIQNAQTHQEVKTLQKVAAALSGTFDMTEVLNLVMEAALKLTRTESGSILFWNEIQEKFAPAFTTSGHKKNLIPYQTTSRPKGGMARQIIASRKPVIVSDTSNVPDINEVALKKNRRALIGVPLLSEAKAIGVLYVNSTEPRQFSDNQVSLLETLAIQAAVAIDRVRQYQELKRTNERVETMINVAWMGTVAGAWRHSIGNQSTIIADLIELIQRDIQSADSPGKIAGRLKEIKTVIGEIQRMPLFPLSGEEGAESVYIQPLIEERINQFRSKEGRYSAVCYEFHSTLDTTVSVRASSEWLRRVIDVVVDNAVEAMRESTGKKLSVAAALAGQGVELIITDTGQGIPPAVQADILTKPIKKAKGERGSGLGLFLARAIVQAYGGSLTIQKTGPTGTTILIWLPVEA